MRLIIKNRAQLLYARIGGTAAEMAVIIGTGYEPMRKARAVVNPAGSKPHNLTRHRTKHGDLLMPFRNFRHGRFVGA